MPKASRGRRPAPNPKKRMQRQGPRTTATSSPDAALEPANGGGVATAVAPAPARPARSSWPPPARRGSAPAAPRRSFNESVADYAYVGADLKRIGALFGALVVLMVVLALVLR